MQNMRSPNGRQSAVGKKALVRSKESVRGPAGARWMTDAVLATRGFTSIQSVRNNIYSFRSKKDGIYSST